MTVRRLRMRLLFYVSFAIKTMPERDTRIRWRKSSASVCSDIEPFESLSQFVTVLLHSLFDVILIAFYSTFDVWRKTHFFSHQIPPDICRCGNKTTSSLLFKFLYILQHRALNCRICFTAINWRFTWLTFSSVVFFVLCSNVVKFTGDCDDLTFHWNYDD